MKNVNFLLATLMSFSWVATAGSQVYFCTSSNEEILARLQLEDDAQNNQFIVDGDGISLIAAGSFLKIIPMNDAMVIHATSSLTDSGTMIAQLIMRPVSEKNASGAGQTLKFSGKLLASSQFDAANYELSCTKFMSSDN